MTDKIRVGIVGAAGYTAGELMRILKGHPDAEITFAQSGSNAGNPVWQVHQDLVGETDMLFCENADLDNADVIFLCSGHGKSKSYGHTLPGTYTGKIIDLSNDFRLASDAEDFV